jgi:glycosyltransferase involved in cell wall biosynthesis
MLITQFANEARPRVHLVNPLWDPHGGSEHRTLDTWRLLSPYCDARLWSEYEPASRFEDEVRINRISPLGFSVPLGGTLVFVGVYFRIGYWITLARPERVVVIYNSDQPDRLAKNLARIALCGRRAEVVATSHALARRLEKPTPLLESPIDLYPFLGAYRPPRSTFTVGRLSRDEPTKHHDEDIDLYRLLARMGIRVRIMGGTCLASRLADTPNIELLPAGAEEPADFLESLDCFIYRTRADWFEGFGRVVFEAMASGLPVVASTRGGYADYVASGRDAFLFDTTAEAARLIMQLRAEPKLRREMGLAARRSARRIVGDGLHARTRRYLLAGVDLPSCSPSATSHDPVRNASFG